jgi:two-component system, sensor histidine kinase LadS
VRWGAVFFLLFWLSIPAQADVASGDSIVLAAEDRLNLSGLVRWCAVAPETEVAVAGCSFVQARPGDLSPGYSHQAFWLRLELFNPSDATLERWLSIGHPRLEEVSFFEASGSVWQRRDSGLRTPLIGRPLAAVDFILPLRLAPGEKRVLMVRVLSRTSLDLTPLLWEPDAYRRASTQYVVIQSLGLGGLVVIALLSLLIWLRSKSRLYLYFAGTGMARVIYMASFTGLLPFFLWPESRPFDIRVIMLGAGGAILFYVPFVRGVVGEFRLNPWANGLLLSMGGVSALAMLWTFLVSYDAVRIMMLASTVDFISGTYLFFSAWRRGNGAAGYMVLANVLFLLIQGAVFTISLGGAGFNQTAVSFYVWGSLLGAPLVLLGLTAHSEDLRERLLVAQAESAARVAFLARMSHELRTPLDTILGTTQLLARSPLGATFATGLADIAQSGWRLLRMIDDILDYARGLAGNLAIVQAPVNLSFFLHSVGNNARLLASRNGNTFLLCDHGGKAANVCLDEGRLRQVLDNLLVNAARHTCDGRVRLDCIQGECVSEGRVRLDFMVSDSGEGIAPEELESIFRPFERGGNTTRRGGKGIGLGLAIARQLVEMMGGELSVTSTPGEGACFRFHVFAGVSEEISAAGRGGEFQSVTYQGGRRTILVVDDIKENRQIVAALLQANGFGVIEAESGLEVADLCLARAEAVDLVLTDQFMVDGDGWGVLADVTRYWPGTPVILMSAAPPEAPEGFPEGLEFAACVLKPLDHTVLLRQIADLLALEPNDSSQMTFQPPEAIRPSGMSPDPADLQILAALAATGQISAILEWAEGIKVRAPGCAGYAEQVSRAAEDLDFAALREYARTGSDGNALLNDGENRG